LGLVVYVLAAQSAHTRSTEAEGSFVTYLPAAQVVQLSHAFALLAAEKVPEAQEAQVRSNVVLGVLFT
jgi:hypothetical protein